MHKAAYNSLFLRVLRTGEDGSRFRSSGGRSLPSDSSQALSSRILRLFALSEREGWTRGGGAIRHTNNKNHQSLEASGQQWFNCFSRLASYSLNCTLCPLTMSGESMKTRRSPSEAAAIQISRESDSWAIFSWAQLIKRAEEKCITALSFNMKGREALPAPLPCALKMFEGGFHICNAHRESGQVLLFIYNTLMRLLHWSTISSSLTLDRWHQREGEEEKWSCD